MFGAFHRKRTKWCPLKLFYAFLIRLLNEKNQEKRSSRVCSSNDDFKFFRYRCYVVTAIKKRFTVYKH